MIVTPPNNDVQSVQPRPVLEVPKPERKQRAPVQPLPNEKKDKQDKVWLITTSDPISWFMHHIDQFQYLAFKARTDPGRDVRAPLYERKRGAPVNIEFTAEIARQQVRKRLLDDQMAFYDHQAEVERQEHEERFKRYLLSAPYDEFNNNKHDRPNRYRPVHPRLPTLAMESDAIN